MAAVLGRTRPDAAKLRQDSRRPGQRRDPAVSRNGFNSGDGPLQYRPVRIPEDKAKRLLARACAIQERKARGFYTPILWHLALRGDVWGMSEVSRLFGPLGPMSNGWGADGLNRRAWRAGNSTAARNQAMSCFNKRDLAEYRRWLRRAARTGDQESAAELRHFETRLPHDAARDIGRHRPKLPRDGFWTEERTERRRSAMRGTKD